MFIETEGTPNPNTLKFLPGLDVTGSAGTVDFIDADAVGTRSPLASALFDLPGVRRVFMGSDFVSVTKADEEDWKDLKPRILASLVDHFVSGRRAVEAEAVLAEDPVMPGDEEIVQQIKELLDTRVRPAVAADGGDIVFRGYRDGIVRLSMQGACSGCPSSGATLKHGVENMLRHYVPEIQSVEQVMS